MSDMCAVKCNTPADVTSAGGTYENGICEEQPQRHVMKVVSGDEYVCVDGNSVCECLPKRVIIKRRAEERQREQLSLQKKMMRLQEKHMLLMKGQMRLNPAYWVDRLLKKIF
jgi:hypothetical protein